MLNPNFQFLHNPISQESNMPSEVKDKKSQPIQEGDKVWTPFRGGKREGDVERIVVTEDEAKETDVKNPPKVRSIQLLGSRS